jgi:hypothetical protein
MSPPNTIARKISPLPKLIIVKSPQKTLPAIQLVYDFASKQEEIDRCKLRLVKSEEEVKELTAKMRTEQALWEKEKDVLETEAKVHDHKMGEMEKVVRRFRMYLLNSYGKLQ